MPHDFDGKQVNLHDRVVLYGTVTSVSSGDTGCNLTVSINNGDEAYKPEVALNTKSVLVIDPNTEYFVSRDPARGPAGAQGEIGSSSPAGIPGDAAQPPPPPDLKANSLQVSNTIFLGTAINGGGGIWLLGPEGHGIDIVNIPGQTYFGLRQQGNQGPNDFAVSVGSLGVHLQFVVDGELYLVSAKDIVKSFGLVPYRVLAEEAAAAASKKADEEAAKAAPKNTEEVGADTVEDTKDYDASDYDNDYRFDGCSEFDSDCFSAHDACECDAD